MELFLGNQVLPMDRSRLMGILNITPDSFSDGGEFLSPDKAIAQAATNVGRRGGHHRHWW